MARIYRPRRTLRRKRPMMRRRRILRRTPSKRAMGVHHFKRTFVGTPFASQTTTSFGGYTLTFAQLPSYLEFANLFDQYRINKVVVKFMPNQSESSVGSTKAIPEFFSVIDPNDATPATSINQLLEYANCKITRGIYTHKRVYTPATLDVVATSGGNVAANPTWKQWLSTANSDTNLYGLKYAIGPTQALGDVYYTPYVTMYFSCKTVK